MHLDSYVYHFPKNSRVSTEMFKFSFNVDRKDNNFLADEEQEQSFADIELPCEESAEIFCSDEHLAKVDLYRERSYVIPLRSFRVLYLKGSSLQELSGSCVAGGTGKAENSHSDLIPGIYEGGAKVWECTGDLIEFLDSECSSALFEGKRVLDAGCGAGLLGVYALLSKASIVHFQDYNEEVLRNITVPTVLLNSPNKSAVMKKCQFFSGDWSKYVEKTKIQEKFDVILTSETIYNVTNYPKLIRMIDEKLAPNGVVFLAAKVYYFGVGGGLRQFEKALEDSQRYVYQTVWKSEIGVSREILRICQKN